MAPRPLLGRILLALLLLAGWAVLTGPTDRAQAAAEIGLSQHHSGGVQQRLQHDRGRAEPVALDAAWGDTDDDTKPLLLTPAIAVPSPFGQRVVTVAPRRPSPLSHWPCAGTPTGPPQS